MRAFPGNDERMSVLHQDSGGIGKSIPSALEISLGHGFCTPQPSGLPSRFALGKSLGSLPILDGARIQCNVLHNCSVL